MWCCHSLIPSPSLCLCAGFAFVTVNTDGCVWLLSPQFARAWKISALINPQNHLSGFCLCYGCNCLHIARQRHTLKSQVWKLVTCLVTLVSDTAALISNKAAGQPTSQSVKLSGGNVNEQFCWTTSAATTRWAAAILMILLGWDTFFLWCDGCLFTAFWHFLGCAINLANSLWQKKVLQTIYYS